MSLLFNTLSRFVKAFLSRSKHLLIYWLQSPSAVILEPRKVKSVTASSFAPSICHEVMGQDVMTLVFEYWVLSQLFHSPLSPSSRGFLVHLHFLPLKGYQLHICGMIALPQASCSGWSSPWLSAGSRGTGPEARPHPSLIRSTLGKWCGFPELWPHLL